MKPEKEYRRGVWLLLRSNEMMLWFIILVSAFFYVIDIFVEKDRFGNWMAFVSLVGGGCLGIKSYLGKEWK